MSDGLQDDGTYRVTVTANACPVLNPSNPLYMARWRALSVEERALTVEGLAARGIVAAGPVDVNSTLPPTFLYPDWHPCVTSGEIRAGEGIYQVRDEGARAAPGSTIVNGTGSSPLPGLGLLANVPDWLKWLAIAAIVVGTVIIVRRRRAA